MHCQTRVPKSKDWPHELRKKKRCVSNLSQGNCLSDIRLISMKVMADHSLASVTITFSLLLSGLSSDSTRTPVSTWFLSVLIPKVLTLAFLYHFLPRGPFHCHICLLMPSQGLSPGWWLFWFQFYVPNALLKINARLSSWWLKLNKLYLRSTSHVFPKPPDLPVSVVKLPPFPFSLSSKHPSLWTIFSFPSSLKFFPTYHSPVWSNISSCPLFHPSFLF